MRTIPVPFAETGDTFEGIYPMFDTPLPRVGDPVVVHCRETGQYYDGVVMETNRYAYSAQVGERRSGRFSSHSKNVLLIMPGEGWGKVAGPGLHEKNYRKGKFCIWCFRERVHQPIADRSSTWLDKHHSCFLREWRKQRNTPRLGTLRGLSNAQRGEETARRIMEILRERGEKMSTDEIALTLGMSRTAISLHLRNQLAPQVKRSRGKDNSAIWEAIMDKDERPKGLFICLACERTWKGEQLFLDPQAIGENWTCGDLTCGGSVLAVDEHEWAQYCEAEIEAGNLTEAPPSSGKPVTEEIPF